MMPYELESMKSVYSCPYVVKIGPIFNDSSPILRNFKIYLIYQTFIYSFHQAVIAQLGERQTEDLKVPGSIPGRGIVFFIFQSRVSGSGRDCNILYIHLCRILTEYE